MEIFTRGYFSLNNYKNIDEILKKLKDIGLKCFKILKINDKVSIMIFVNGCTNYESEEILDLINYDKKNQIFDISSNEDRIAIEKNSENLKDFDLLVGKLEKINFNVIKEKSQILELEV